MNACISEKLIREVAQDMKVHPSFVEKDWVIVRATEAVGTFQMSGVSFVLSGGTSLSKGYNLIKRFSEDLDFKIITAKCLTKSVRKEIRRAFIDEIGKIDGFSVENIQTGNEGKNCRFDVVYSGIADIPSFLRRNLQIELYFDDENVEHEKREIKSLVSEYMGRGFDTKLDCLNPFYTAVDKFCALMWRLFEDSIPVDYTLLRHLHDLYALSEYCANKNKFSTRVVKIFERKDRKRIENDVSFREIVCSTCNKLKTNQAYKMEYEKYVSSMCYVSEDKSVPYETALSNVLKVAEYFM